MCSVRCTVTLEGEFNYIRPSTDIRTRRCVYSDVPLLWKVSVTIFGPALTYGLGVVFSQIYVTLEGECNYIWPSTDIWTRRCVQSDVRYAGK